ncbi:polysaccharide deacetylase family protein [Lentibacillus sp. Marseille-P4043]|uniref:polysaccharide deacetylase family protein n=1 Tax=Lentibacillus sp. Marseille-P4043 TaxID=2040293 RepID=UPI000D0BCEFA|nr:polysaccharide deacetylase family protein [Lentibacillus sp. Marseille-P4043]
MKRRRHLNRRGKLLVLVLSILSLFFLVGLMDYAKKGADPKATKPAEQSMSTIGPKKTFTDSKLNHSILEKKVQERQKKVAEKREHQRIKDQKGKAIYLTFDDGPTTDTSQLLDVLEHYNVQATFFMIGPRIENNPEVVKRMAELGLGLGLHGISHSVGQIYSSQTAPLKEMRQDQRIVEEVTGNHTQLVRLPYGSVPYLTEDMRYLLYKNGFQIWDWNVDSRDWELGDGQFVNKTIQEIEKVEEQGETPVVLMHDQPETIHYLPKLLSYLQKNGYQTKKITKEVPAITFTCNGRCYAI